VTVTAQNLSADQHDLMNFHQDLMGVRSRYPALSHGDRQHLYSDETLYVDLKSYADQQIVFAMNTSDQPITVQLNPSLFSSNPSQAWDVLTLNPIAISGGFVDFVLAPLSGSYILVNELPVLPGDFNADHVVNAADDVWRAHLGTTVGGGASVAAAASIPEPQAAPLFLAAMGFLAVFRYQFSRHGD
jgi:hypothetical protein